ncbi:MAG: hypothetical protein IKH02_02345 [Prevotella sp.]|jgi:hypothetical protein|nr:hypothetical protein [Prevotella sp.]MBR3087837.1 hypothetical protein [Prevotella sp.]
MKITKITFVAALALMAVGCTDKKEANIPVIKETKAVAQGDETKFGECVNATSHSFQLVQIDGDTLDFIVEEQYLSPEDSLVVGDVVCGGLYDGNKMAVMATPGEEGLVVRKAINVTSLMGRWTSLDKNFEIKDGGVVESHVQNESNPYTEWKILNGKLVLSKDTFNILSIGNDSLYLENEKGIYAYKRQLE